MKFLKQIFSIELSFIYSNLLQDECQVGFNVGGDDFLFGDTFFNQATVIFDRDNDRIGFGPK